jgi:uncharacterized protein (DUF2062 family)
MNGRQFTFGASGNPIVQVLSLLVLGAVLIGAVAIGAVLLAVVLGLAVVAAMVFAVRLWWVRRKLAKRPPAGGQARGELIEVEYTVVEERDPQDRRK